MEASKGKLTIHQAEQLLEVAKSIKNDIRIYLAPNKAEKFAQIEKNIYAKLVEAIDATIYETDSIEKLKEFKGKLLNPSSIKEKNIHEKISRKIIKLRQQKFLEEAKTDVSKNMKSIVAGLAEGTIDDIEKVQEQIKQEATMELQSKGKPVTEETQRKAENQILLKIGNQLKEKSKEYPIADHEKTLEQLKQLNNGDIVSSLNVVAINLKGLGKFEEANQICSEYLKPKYNGQVNYRNVTMLRNKVRNAEVTNIAMRIINDSEKSKDEQIELLEILESKLDKWQVDPKTIVLNHQDGLKSVTLDDVWYENDRGQR